jgi:hypothetical protein
MPSILKIPLDTSVPFRATHAFYLSPEDRTAHTIRITDVTIALHEQEAGATQPYLSEITASLLSAAKAAASAPKSPTTASSATAADSSSSSSSSTLQLIPTQAHSGADTRLVDSARAELAAIYAPAISYGAAQITFPRDSPHQSHNVALKPLALGRRALGFVLDGAECAWEGMERFAAGKMRLVRATSGRKVVVARFESLNGTFRPEGLLLVNTEQPYAGLSADGSRVGVEEAGTPAPNVSAVTALVTLAAVFKQRDSWYMPGLNLSRKKSAAHS